MCNFTLQLLKSFTATAIGLHGPLSREDKELLKDFPTDVRTVRRLFDLDPPITLYAACPTCSMTYAPTFDANSGDIPIYPRRCSHRAWPTSAPCNARLTKGGVREGESVRVPIRPFPVQDFDVFVGRMLSQPGVEAAIRASLEVAKSGVLCDIAESERVRELYARWKMERHTDDDDDLLLLWSCSVDWFNPLGNKAAGKSVSCGSIAMLCLLLPPSLRIKPAFVYVNGIIPHPEPSHDQINHFTRPIVSTLEHNWTHGVWYSRTYECPGGRRVYSAHATDVSDLPGSRKTSGQHSHSAHRFCALCDLTRPDINNLDISTWKLRVKEEIYRQAVAWRDAPNGATRKRLYKQNGVRWSEFWRLPYWDITKSVIIDGMHSLFLRIVRHHVRVILGLDLPADDDDDSYAPVVDQSMEKALSKLDKKLTTSCTAKVVEGFGKAVLWEACRRHGVDMSGMTYKQMKKRILAEALLVGGRADACGR